MAFFTTTSYYLQAVTCLFIWAMSYLYIPKMTSLFLAFISILPFLFSPSYWIEMGYNVNILFGLAQMSPLYQVLRLDTDPWNGVWAYVDSPFHYGLEGLETLYSCLPLLFLLLSTCLAICLRKNAKS